MSGLAAALEALRLSPGLLQQVQHAALGQLA